MVKSNIVLDPERVISILNCLPDSVDFISFFMFKRTVKRVNAAECN